MNLIICLTPLQMLIAEKIISLFPSEKFSLIVIALNDNQKYRYYYDRLSVRVDRSIYFSDTFRFFSFIKFIIFFKFIKKWGNIYYNKYFVASIDSRYVHYVLSQTNNPVVYTFDDGTMNIYRNSTYYQKTNINLLKYLLWKFLGVRYFQEDVKLFSRLHYSIYFEVDNIIDNVQYLKLFDFTNNSKDKKNNSKIEQIQCGTGNGESISFFLGQPLNDFGDNIDYNVVNDFIDRYNISYYFLHPRENLRVVEDIINVPIFNSELVFEDFILNFCMVNRVCDIKLYSISSSVIFNLSSIASCFFVCDDSIYRRYKQMYDLAYEKFGISIISLL
ncbi:glycosyltransferase family 52 [Conchiformibius steedae]|uniref:CMP-N-acetylneuraminate-beta-galactosamide-alpha-2, 3-sialyltransferase n=1 Tax=Conchiformibius steedae TaxID=153493 RepID=A0A3P2A7C8_9NEIS|nr:glycosyltransferase family 52 [Conchiformibius steedae]RRD91307.1 hypothetical protein EII21_02670 [Conchiformibius steedae]